jgi:hypothetical protein
LISSPTFTRKLSLGDQVKEKGEGSHSSFHNCFPFSELKLSILAKTHNYLAGTDNYPLDVDSTVTLLSHYHNFQSNGGRNKVDSDGGGGVEATSFAQHKKKEKQKDKQKCVGGSYC